MEDTSAAIQLPDLATARRASPLETKAISAWSGELARKDGLKAGRTAGKSGGGGAAPTALVGSVLKVR
jgi:hypothetical protein